MQRTRLNLSSLAGPVADAAFGFSRPVLLSARAMKNTQLRHVVAAVHEFLNDAEPTAYARHVRRLRRLEIYVGVEGAQRRLVVWDSKDRSSVCVATFAELVLVLRDLQK